ncbi:hypothetical protein MMC15_004731 [Xylographa vitiligo]|nr:hypothetical protein [Xylographa vitiligo]
MPPSIWSRISPICALAPTTVFSILLIAYHKTKFVGHAAVWVENSRDSVAIIVQIVATIFGFCQSYMLCSLINYATRIHLVGRTAKLDTLGLYTALSIPRVDTSLSASKTLLTGVLLIFTHLLSAIWAGAITPLTTTQQSGSGNISIPAYPNGVQPNWSYEYETGLVNLNCQHTNSVSNCAVFDLSGGLIDSLRTATSPVGPRLHAKLDNATWTYSGRSYGVGSSQGLAAVLDNSTDPYTAYSYLENGYLTEVSCEYNTSTNWTLDDSGYGMSTTVIYTAKGSLPQVTANSSVPYYVTVDDDELHAVAWTAASFAKKQGSIAIAAIGRYLPLNQTQCSVTFSPTQFYVAVNNTMMTIVVTPQGQIEDFESTGTLVDYMMASFGLLSRISPNVVVSTIGNAIGNNKNNYNLTYPGLNATTALPLRAMEASFAAVLDDLLLGEAAAQLFLARVNSTVDVTKDFEAIQFGSLRYIILALVTNSVLAIILLLEGIRTRLWRDLPSFNPTKIKDVVAASFSAITRSRSLHPHSQAGGGDDEALLSRLGVKLDDENATLDIMVNGATARGTSHVASWRNVTSEEENDIEDSTQHTAYQDEADIPLVRMA